ncbi:hypothetical protein BDW72DRAFT_182026 [Aspergillus terricola var. indicus]
MASRPGWISTRRGNLRISGRSKVGLPTLAMRMGTMAISDLQILTTLPRGAR